MKKLIGLSTMFISILGLFAQETAPPPQSSLNKTSPQVNRTDTLRPDNNTWLKEAQASDSLKRNFDNKYGSDSANDWKRRINQQDTAALRSEEQLKQRAEADRRSTGLDSALSNANQRRQNSTLPKDSALTADKDRSRQPADSVKKLGDRIVMKDNTLTLYKGENVTVVTESMKLDDGTVAMPNGTLKLPSGKMVTLKNGQYINIKPKQKSPGKPAVKAKMKSA